MIGGRRNTFLTIIMAFFFVYMLRNMISRRNIVFPKYVYLIMFVTVVLMYVMMCFVTATMIGRYQEWNLEAFLYGMFSGIIEPIVAIFGVLLAYYIQPLMPWALALAAGCMIYVTIEDLIPTAVSGEGKNHYGIISFIVGFLIMMSLDYLLG